MGHHHDHDQRHHHRAADHSLLILDSDRASDATAADSAGSLDVTTVVCLAVVVPASLWTAQSLSHQRAMHVTWQPSFAIARMLDRPPQPT